MQLDIQIRLPDSETGTRFATDITDALERRSISGVPALMLTFTDSDLQFQWQQLSQEDVSVFVSPTSEQ